MNNLNPWEIIPDDIPHHSWESQITINFEISSLSGSERGFGDLAFLALHFLEMMLTFRSRNGNFVQWTPAKSRLGISPTVILIGDLDSHLWFGMPSGMMSRGIQVVDSGFQMHSSKHESQRQDCFGDLKSFWLWSRIGWFGILGAHFLVRFSFVLILHVKVWLKSSISSYF